MPSDYLDSLPPEKQLTGTRVIFTSVRKNIRTKNYHNLKYVSNSKILSSKYKNIPGQTCLGQSRKDGSWKILFVNEKVV